MFLAFKINAFAGRENALEYAVDEISNAGFKNIGLVFDRPYLWLEHTTPQAVACISRMLARRNLAVSSVSACTASGYIRDKKDLTPPGQRFGPSFASKDQAERKLRIEHTKKVIDFTCELGCNFVDVSTGYQPTFLDFATTWSNTRECLWEVCEYAHKKQVFINSSYARKTSFI